MKIIYLLFVMFFCFPHCCTAYDAESFISEEINLPALIDHLPEPLEAVIRDNIFISGQALSELMTELKLQITEAFSEHLTSAWKPAAQTLMIVLICSVFSILLSEKKYDFPVVLVGSSAIIYVCIADIESYFNYSIRVIQEIYDFSTVLLPCMAGVSVFAGATISAGVKYTVASLFMNILLNFCNTFLVPFVNLYLATVIGYHVFGQRILGAISNFVRWGCLTVLTGFVVVFTSYLSVAGILSASGDLLSARVASTTISNLLPIVGNIISDTASTLVSGASYMRSCIGVIGLISVLFIFAVPLVSVASRYLLFKAVSEISDIYPNHKFSGVIKGISDAYGMLFAIVGSGLIMLFLTLLSFMQLAVP